MADKQKVIQIMVNLISNANKFTDIDELFQCLAQSQSNKLTITVEDNGIGISSRDQCTLFNTFMQVQNSTNKTGTGLGLAITKSYVNY